MKLRAFNPTTDMSAIRNWWSAKEQPLPELIDLPPIGLVAYDEMTDAKIAACWLCRTDGAFALLEWGCANPDLPKEVRDMGLNALLSQLQEIAAGLGFRYVCAITKVPAITQRLEAASFVRPQTEIACLIKSL